MGVIRYRLLGSFGEEKGKLGEEKVLVLSKGVTIASVSQAYASKASSIADENRFESLLVVLSAPRFAPSPSVFSNNSSCRTLGR